MKQNLKTALFAVIVVAITFPLLSAAAQVEGPITLHRRQPSADSIPQLSANSIQIDADTVRANVTITDASGHLAPNLQKKNFRLFEDNVEQKILTFSRKDVPASIGLLFDTSGSMSDKMVASRHALAQFLQNSNPKDEFFLVSFNNRPELKSSFTSDIEQLQERTMSLKPRGRTSLLDAIYFGVAQMKSARYDRHVLLVISDGGDNHSRHDETEVRNLLRESDCQLYGLGIFDAHDASSITEDREGPRLLSELAETTGGHVFQAANLWELLDLSGNLGVELQRRYVIGYKPSDPRPDSRRIKVSLTPFNDWHLMTHARTGYYTPQD
ncbi:MAG: VWA domain-containing protein [Acidobacteria bacterium]|nr:MAG: VWA domain-containing protein [Acidobacteriota bacterium]